MIDEAKQKHIAGVLGIKWGTPYTIWPSEDRMDKNGFYPRTHVDPKNPKFNTPDGLHLLLNKMMQRPDGKIYLRWLVTQLAIPPEEVMADYFLDTTGKFCDAVYEFLVIKGGKE